MKKSKKPFRAGIEEEDPLDRDMSDWIRGGDWYRAKFEFTKKKNKTITIRLSEELLKGLKGWANDLGVDYQKLIRIILENSLRKKSL